MSTRGPHGPPGSEAPWRLWNTVKRSVVTTGSVLQALTTVWHDPSLRFTNGARMRKKLMAYGIGLVFDQQTEAHIREVWCRLASQGFATPLARPGCLPHVSLALSETLHVEDLARDIEGLGHSPLGLEVRFSPWACSPSRKSCSSMA